MNKKIIKLMILTILTLSLWSNAYAETQGEVNLSVTVLPRLTIDDFDFSEINPNAVASSQEEGEVAGVKTEVKKENQNILLIIYNWLVELF